VTLFALPGENDRAADEAAPAGPLLRVVLQLAYDGTGFHGFARQPRQRTVGGELADALARMSGAPVDVVCAGRTDSGVHASGQVVHTDLPASYVTAPHRGMQEGDLSWLARSLTSQLGPEIAVRSAAAAVDGFDARHSAVARRYRFSVLNTPVPDPLLARTSWHVDEELDLAALRLASDAILGEHDFAGFCRRPPDAAAGTPIMRRVVDAAWSRSAVRAGLLCFEIESNAFCHQMVRSLVGSLVAVGAGRITGAEIGRRLRSGERQGAPTLAPPHGLCLLGVRYPDPFGSFSTLGAESE
jgi:tRNA pseudouridine38-40 synthase